MVGRTLNSTMPHTPPVFVLALWCRAGWTEGPRARCVVPVLTAQSGSFSLLWTGIFKEAPGLPRQEPCLFASTGHAHLTSRRTQRHRHTPSSAGTGAPDRIARGSTSRDAGDQGERTSLGMGPWMLGGVGGARGVQDVFARMGPRGCVRAFGASVIASEAVRFEMAVLAGCWCLG